MSSPNNGKPQFSKVKKMIFMAMLLAMALVLGYMERFIPVPFAFPGVKLGLANIITLMALYIFGFWDTMVLVWMRVVMNAVFVGSMMSLWYSLAGGLLSLLVMALAIKLLSRIISTVGISILGAIAHNIGQLSVVAVITGSVRVAISYFPVLAVSAVVTGILIGVTVTLLKSHLAPIYKRFGQELN